MSYHAIWWYFHLCHPYVYRFRIIQIVQYFRSTRLESNIDVTVLLTYQTFIIGSSLLIMAPIVLFRGWLASNRRSERVSQRTKCFTLALSVTLCGQLCSTSGQTNLHSIYHYIYGYTRIASIGITFKLYSTYSSLSDFQYKNICLISAIKMIEFRIKYWTFMSSTVILLLPIHIWTVVPMFPLAEMSDRIIGHP